MGQDKTRASRKTSAGSVCNFSSFLRARFSKKPGKIYSESCQIYGKIEGFIFFLLLLYQRTPKNEPRVEPGEDSPALVLFVRIDARVWRAVCAYVSLGRTTWSQVRERFGVVGRSSSMNNTAFWIRPAGHSTVVVCFDPDMTPQREGGGRWDTTERPYLWHDIYLVVYKHGHHDTYSSTRKLLLLYAEYFVPGVCCVYIVQIVLPRTMISSPPHDWWHVYPTSSDIERRRVRLILKQWGFRPASTSCLFLQISQQTWYLDNKST